MNWQHDGSFAGFLTTVFRIFEARDTQAIVRSVGDGPDLFTTIPPTPAPNNDALALISPQDDLAARVYKGVAREGGLMAAIMLRDAFLHREGGGSQALLGFVRQVMQYGTRSLDRLTDPAVHETDRRARAVGRETHRFQGLLRFHAIEDDEISLYAAFRPDHDVLPLLLPHFRDRLGERSWMIHDLGRSQAAIFRDGGLERITGIQLAQSIPETADEAAFQAMWKGYFRHIAIPERRNPKLQRSLMPKKYWDLLVEVPGSASLG